MNETIHMKIEKPEVIDLNKWKQRLEVLQKDYQTGQPYPHIVIDDFLNTSTATKALETFPAVKDDGWIHYVHVNEKNMA